MTPDIEQLNFIGTDAIDKIVYEGEQTIINDGATSSPQSSKIVTASVPNPYAKKCFVRYTWSIDGVSFNGSDAHLVYTFTYTFTPGPFSTTMGGLQGAVSVGVNASNIIFRTANGLHGNVSDDGFTITYTPVSQTFKVKYALFEVE